MNTRPKSAVVVKSFHHGNTLKVAKVIAEQLQADLFDADEVSAKDLDSYDVIALGSGIYYGMHHSELVALAHDLSERERSIILFSTSGLPYLKRLFHWRLRRAITRDTHRIIGELNCPGRDSFGPLKLIGGLNRKRPDFRDLKSVREQVESIIESNLSTTRSTGRSTSVTQDASGQCPPCIGKAI